MANDSKVECRCSQRPEALWSYCIDDFFCPRCGKDVTRLTSDNRHPDPGSGEIWVYPRKVENNEPFAFPLKLEYSDHERRIQECDPEIEIEKCDIDPNAYFKQALKIPQRTKKFLVWLEQSQDDVHQSLPDGGVSLRVPRLVGNFGDTALSLRIGKKPSVDVEITGKGIEPVTESEKTGTNERALKKRFRITSSGKLELKLTIKALTAPILITKPIDTFEWRAVDDTDSIAGSIAFVMERPLEAETVISPDEPWTTNVTLDTTQFSIPGQKTESNQNLFFLGWPRFRISLQLERIDKGGLDISPLTIDEMFLGEIRSNAPSQRLINPEDPTARHYQPVIGKLYVRNMGNESVTLERPVAKKSESFDWISVAWSTDVDDGSKRPRTDGKLVLDADERGEIEVQVDLRNVTQNDLGNLESLIADILVRNRREEETFETKVIVNQVQARTKAPAPLTIDFGNTSSYAAMWNPKDQTTRFTEEIIPVHNLRTPESFPTALFFHEATDDPYAATYDIGNAAIFEGFKQAKKGRYGALAVDLKRWIGSLQCSKNIIDADDNSPVRYKNHDLIVLYLKRIIENAESILRRYTITEISVSHPAKFTLQRRKSFHQIIDLLCETVNQERSAELKLTRIEEDIDEANAVAVGSVFDPTTEDILYDLVTPERPKFVVASFDMGGGSLDTALIRFHVRDGEIEIPDYTTEYLGIGGHSSFGGDNVTLAVMELLKNRIRETLNKQNLPGDQCLKCVPNPTDRDQVDAQRRHNYTVLWEVSEEIKVHQCQAASQTPTEEESVEFATRIQARLLHELVLDPSAAGTLQRDADVDAALKVLIDENGFLISLDKIYAHEIEHDLLLGDELYTIRQRLEHTIEELKQFAGKNDIGIDFVVFGGAGSRLPLVGKLVAEQIPDAHLIQDKTRTKFRVAHGLARFLNALTSAHDFARSSDYTISEFGYVLPGGGRFLPIVPNCVPVKQDSAGHPIIAQRSKKPLNLDRLCDDQARIVIHRQDQGEKRTLHGYFDLSEPAPKSDGGKPRGYSRDELQDAVGEIRLAGSEDEMELAATINEQSIGRWKLISDSTQSKAETDNG
jgi:molecular chaperone DnaK (HSP70)